MYSEVNKVYNLPRFVGTFPFDKEFNVSVPFLCVTLLQLCVLIVCFVLSVIDSMYWIAGFAELFLLDLQFFFGTFNCFFTVFWFLLKRPLLKSSLMEISKILEEKPAGEIPRWLWISHYLETYGMIALFNLLVCACIDDIRAKGLTLHNLILSIINATFMFSYIGQLRGIYRLLSYLLDPYHPSAHLEEVLRHQENLISIINSVHFIYSPSILINIGWSFVIIVINLCIFIVPYLPKEDVSMLSVFASIGWLLYPIISVVSACRRISLQMRNMNESIYWRIVQDDTGALINDDLSKLHFSRRREISFTAYGLFNINNSLICAMIAAVTTYVVIMLQFGSGVVSMKT